jgi:DNA-binding transcriptional regulator YdaS (Cro superfamily)
MSKELIKELGGAKVVADALNISPGSVANWCLADRSIPWRWRFALADVAKARGVVLPHGFLAPTPETRT